MIKLGDILKMKDDVGSKSIADESVPNESVISNKSTHNKSTHNKSTHNKSRRNKFVPNRSVIAYELNFDEIIHIEDEPTDTDMKSVIDDLIFCGATKVCIYKLPIDILCNLSCMSWDDIEQYKHKDVFEQAVYANVRLLINKRKEAMISRC